MRVEADKAKATGTPNQPDKGKTRLKPNPGWLEMKTNKKSDDP